MVWGLHESVLAHALTMMHILECFVRQAAATRGLKKMGAERATPVVLGPVTWVHLSRHANPTASSEQTTSLKKEYLEAILPIYKVLLQEFELSHQRAE